jgi:hypothetical protein
MSNAVHVYVSQADKGELVMGAGIDAYNGYAQRGSFHVIEHQMAAALDVASVEDFRWHDLRHHFASVLISNGQSATMTWALPFDRLGPPPGGTFNVPGDTSRAGRARAQIRQP